MAKRGVEPLRIVTVPQHAVSARDVGDGSRARRDTALRFRRPKPQSGQAGRVSA